METSDMPAQKNLQASVPPALLARAQAVAQREQISLDDLAAEALQEHIARRTLERFRHEGETRRRGLSDQQVESIVDQAIHEYRQAQGL